MDNLVHTLRMFRDGVESLLKGDDRLDSTIEPTVVVMHDDLSGTLNVNSYMDGRISDMLREEINGKMESDVFMLSCSGVFHVSNKSMKLNCAIVNEDGMPVNVQNSSRMKQLNEFINDTRHGIFSVFKSI